MKNLGKGNKRIFCCGKRNLYQGSMETEKSSKIKTNYNYLGMSDGFRSKAKDGRKSIEKLFFFMQSFTLNKE